MLLDENDNDASEGDTMEEQWRVVDQIVALVTRVVRYLPALDKISLSVEVNDTQKFLPHMVPNDRGLRERNLLIDNSMLTLIKTKQVVDQYKALFWFILDRGSVKRLTI